MFGRIIMRVRHVLACALAILGAILLVPIYIICGTVYALEGYGTFKEFYVITHDKVCSSDDEEIES